MNESEKVSEKLVPLLDETDQKQAEISLVVGLPLPKLETQAKLWPQVAIALLVDICPFLAGLSTGFGGIFLPDIRNDPDIQATLEQGSWIASLASLGCIPGSLVAAWTSEQFGRCRTLQIGVIPFVAGWAMIAFAPNVDTLFVGRFSIGIGMGIMSGVKQVYLSEICHKKYRGMLSSTPLTATTFGMLVAYLLALGMIWRSVAIFGIVISAAALFSYVIFLPETPTWLVNHNRETDARNILKKIRGELYDTQNELSSIVKRYNDNEEEIHAARGHWKQSLALYFSPQTLKAFGIIFLLFFTQRYSGSPVITSYIKDIFDTTSSGGTIDGHYVAILTGVIRSSLTLVSNFLLKSVRKKILYAVSGFGMTVSLFGLATYYYISDTSDSEIGYTWIPGVCVCAFIAFVTPGFYTASWVLLGELFPQRTRGTMSSILSCLGFVLHFSVVKTYPDLIQLVNTYGAFWIYGTVALIGTILVIIILPETKGKTLTQIEDGLAKHENTGNIIS